MQVDAQASGAEAVVRTPHGEKLRVQRSDAQASSAPALPAVASAPAAVRDSNRSELSRLFIVCGRGRKLDELRALFSACGTIKHLHLALDRSKKSRGFAFLQYEDPENAAAAIEKLDRLKLDDGHVLKVTIAKEKPAGGSGKLKRSQHARQDPDEKVEGGILCEVDSVLDARLPGKRQRSSPPAAALPGAPYRSPSAVLLGRNPVDEGDIGRSGSTRTVKQELQADQVISAQLTTTGLADGAIRQVHMLLDDMVAALEQQERGHNALAPGLNAAYECLVSSAERVKSEPGDGKLLTADPAVKREPQSFGSGTAARVKQHGTDEDGETSTDLLTSSIGSVSLTSTPIATGVAPLDASRGRVATSVGLRSGKHHLRRRRQSIDDSGSSTEDGFDDSGSRRKRSNTTTSPPPTFHPRAHTARPLWSPSSNLSDRNDMRLSLEALAPETIVKKPCKRQSSDNTIENSYRLAKQQATDASRDRERDPRCAAPDVHAACSGPAVKLEAESAFTKTKLFFTSTYKFTQQEVEAMFTVYKDLESVELVKSFGRVKTMAYMRYSKPTTAAAVVKSFQDESAQDADDLEKNEFMMLSFAHEPSTLQPPTSQEPKLAGEAKGVHYPAAPSPRLSLNSTSTAQSGDPNALTTGSHERLWILLLYDRFLATHMLSAVVSSYAGMEFMDIKVVKSTGEAQGVAFVKFESEQSATQAALQLHQMELPLGSGKYLQAIVIMSPSLFTTTHGINGVPGNDEPMRLHRTAGERVVTGSSEDVDLRAVEARFAHLMRNTAAEAYYPPQYPPLPPSGSRARGLETQASPMAATGYAHAAQAAQANPGGYHSPAGSSTSLEYYPMVYPPPQQQFQAYAAGYGTSESYQQHQQQAFGAAVPTWMDTTPYYQGGGPQYPFSYMPQQQVAYPVARVDNIEGSNAVSTRSEAVTTVEASKPRGSSSSAEQMDAEDSTSNCGSSSMSFSIHVSSNQPLELMALANALHGCTGVVAFRKDTTAAYIVDFGKEAQAAEAMRTLDGTMCNGQKLRVTMATSTRHRGGGGKPRSGSGRRKRQRVDLRSRK